jgi:ABC-type antimicrobial peptide transport system permease subunit
MGVDYSLDIASVSRERVQAIDPGAQVVRAVPFRDLAHERLPRPRFSAFLLNAFGGVAMLLATVGLYAVMATHVRQRGRDIAVRSALGATGAHLRRLILGEALVLMTTSALAAYLPARRAARIDPLIALRYE